MGVVLGIIFHFIGGFASGSFYVPFRRVKGWSWILHMAFIILISSAWGLFLKEWKGVSRRTLTMVMGGSG